MIKNIYLRPRRPPITGLPKCSGCVNGNWSSVSLSLKCRPLFRHNALRRNVVMSPSSNTTVYCEQSWILVIVASTCSRRSGCLTSTLAPTRSNSHLIWSSDTVPEPRPCLYATLHLMFRTTLRTFASQKAPLYLALTSVPTDKYGGSSTCWNDENWKPFN